MVNVAERSAMAADANKADFELLSACGALLTRGVEAEQGWARRSEGTDVVEILRSHRMLGALHTEGLTARLPEGVAKAAERMHREVLRANLGMVGQLSWLFGLLRGAGIEFALLKGPVLAEAAWGHLGARAFGDIDLLVREELLERAAGVLRAAGFEEGELPLAYERVFLHHARSFKVELHGRLVSRAFLPGWTEAAVWPTVEVEVPGVGKVPTLREEWHFLFNGLHAAKHLLEFFFPPAPIVRLGLYVEIARWAERRSLDWEFLLSECDRLGCRRAVLHGPACAQAWFGWVPPARLQSLGGRL